MTQAVVTVALAVYLLGLTLTIVGNTGSGSSALIRTVKSRLWSPWMVPLWLDLGFDYRLTYGSEEDADHALEVRPYGDPKAATVRLPGRLVGERASRWRRLARAMVVVDDDADRDGLLAAAVGRGMFDDLAGKDLAGKDLGGQDRGSQDLGVSIVRTPLVDRGGPPTSPAQVYSARVRMVGGELQLLRSEPRGEVAPLVRPIAGVKPLGNGVEPDAEGTR